MRPVCGRPAGRILGAPTEHRGDTVSEHPNTTEHPNATLARNLVEASSAATWPR